MSESRGAYEHVFSWANGGTDSNSMELGGGAFGTLLVPVGSALVGKTVQFVAVSDSARYAPTALLASAKSLAAGSNPLTTEEILEMGAASKCFLRVNSAVESAASLVLLWKA